MPTANSPEAWSERAVLGTSAEAAGWSEHGQFERMLAACRHLKTWPGCSILDYGCGTGRLIRFLPSSVRYFGYDWAEGMRERARRDQPQATILDWVDPRTALFDHIAAIGTFNLREGWSVEQTEETLRTLWSQARPVSLVASLYRGDDPLCIRYDPARLVSFASSLTKRWHLDASYLDNDLMLVLQKEVVPNG